MFLSLCLQDASPRIKIVVALYPFKAIESGDLSLEKVSVEAWTAPEIEVN